MKTLVLGANGQLGRDCLECLPAGSAVGLDLPDIDITSADSIARALDAHAPGAVVNCAAFTAVDKAESCEEAARTVNAIAPGLVGRECARRGIRVVHISTDYVFDGLREPPTPYVETDAPAPLSAYGRTKREGEERLLDSGAHAAILRTAWLYGAHGRNFPKTMLRLALAHPTRPLRVVDDQWGSPTWSWRLARQIATVLAASTFPQGVFHATAHGFTTWHVFAETFLRAMGCDAQVLPCATADYPTPARRPRNSILDNAALTRLGLDTMADWRDDVLTFASRHHDALLAEAASAAAGA